MSSQSLPLKYRPLIFEDLIGQELNSKFLSTLITKGPIGKNIILYGPFGASKTTSARIYARALNCLSPTESGSPCNVCNNCESMLKNQFNDYLEVDGSSSGRIDSIKELLEIARTPPMYGDFRVISIDECQGLSRQAWDTLLKLIEEPPPNLVFVFTTTEIDKVREAIRSRCQNLEVKLLNPDAAKQFLVRVCNQEGFKYEDQALDLLVFLSKGHPRDLLKNLEQISYMGDIDLDNSRLIFNLDFVKTLVKLFNALMDNDLEAVLSLLGGWSDNPIFIHEKIIEFTLIMYYYYIRGFKISVDPVFEAIPENDFKEVFLKLKQITGDCGIDSEDGILQILKFLKEDVISSRVSLELSMINLIWLIHGTRFGSNDSQGVVVSSKKEDKRRPGRRFISEVVESKKETKESNLKIDEPEKEDKIYTHTLLKYGFKIKDVKIREVSDGN